MLFVFRKKIFSGRIFSQKAIHLLLAVLLIFAVNSPGKLFSQTMPDPWNSGLPGADRRVLDYQFDRADRELNPGRWMEEARRGISIAMNLWIESVPEIFLEPEARAGFMDWTEKELEKRFTRWLLERFFGDGIKVPADAVFREADEANKYLIYHIGPEGNILYDSGTGDPIIIRPGDDKHDFAEDLAAWQRKTGASSERESYAYHAGLKENYPELLMYIPAERREEFEKKLEAAGESLAMSLRQEFEAILAREERYFTAQRLGDVWSLRKKSEDKSADAIGEMLIEEARQICADSIAAIETKIESAKGADGDLTLAGTQWLEEYREQFNRGLKAWESAEERFLVRRIEWEQAAEKSFDEGRETWNAVFVRFEEERKNWEEEAGRLFTEGERFFAQASESLEAAIAGFSTEYEKERRLRTAAVSERTAALADIFILSGSACAEAEKNIDFWLAKYLEINPDAEVPSDISSIETWAGKELAGRDSLGLGTEGIIFEELKSWSLMHRSYTEKLKESRESLLKELYLFSGAASGVDGNDVFYPDYRETELIRSRGELDYWNHRAAMAKAVLVYAEALDAGRITASEGLNDWEKAKIAYNGAAALYAGAEDSLKAGGEDVSAARTSLAEAAEKMKAAAASLENIRRDYQLLVTSLGSRESAAAAEKLDFLRRELETERKIIAAFADDSLWGKFFTAAREAENRQREELNAEILKRLVAGGGDDGESLAVLARKAEDAVPREDDPFFGLAKTLKEEFHLSGEQYYFLLSAFENNFVPLAESRLKQRLAALSLVVENVNTRDWYYSVYPEKEILHIAIPDTKKRLLADWEEDWLELVKARAELELSAFDFMDGKNTEKAAGIMAALYTGDETRKALDREYLENILKLILPVMADNAEKNAGDSYQYLIEASAGDEKTLHFLSGGSFINSQYGTNVSETLLTDYYRGEEFTRILYNSYLESASTSPAAAKENIQQGYSQLRRLWETLGIETGDSIFPGTKNILNALENLHGTDDDVSSLLIIIDEIFYQFPSWLELSLHLWRESFIEYRVSPTEDNLARAERQSEILNASLLVPGMEDITFRVDYKAAAERYLTDPLLEWNENLFISGNTRVSDDYEKTTDEISNRYFREKTIMEEIDGLSVLVDKLKQGIAGSETEIQNAAGAVALAEDNYRELTASYRSASEDFRRAGEAYDVLYAKAGLAFGNLNAARRELEIRESVKQWAETAYLDNRRPAEELRLCIEKADRARDALELLETLAPEGGRARDVEYAAAYERYKKGIALFTVSEEALFKLSETIKHEEERNSSSYFEYRNTLSALGKSFSPEADYVSPEDTSLWNIKDVISVDDDGHLVFARDDNFVLSGADQKRSGIMNEYFTENKISGDEPLRVSSFELALRELCVNLSGKIVSPNDYINLGLARDYLIGKIAGANADIACAGGWYKTAEAVKNGNNLGNMIIPRPFPMPDTRVREIDKDALRDVKKNQEEAWNSLDGKTRKDLEFYTILALLGGGGNNSEYFSRVSELQEYKLIFREADKTYSVYRHLASMFLVGLLYSHDAGIARATRNALAVPLDKLNSDITLGYNELAGTLNSLSDKLGAYRDSSEMLSVLKGEHAGIAWNDIESAIDITRGFGGDLNALKEIWEGIDEKQRLALDDVPSALKLLTEVCGGIKEENTRYLNGVWKTALEERAAGEAVYRELYNTFLDGRNVRNDLRSAALVSFGQTVPSEKEHFYNIGRVLLEGMGQFAEQGLIETPECTMLAGEFIDTITKAWEEKYNAEFNVRKNEWDLQRKEILEKHLLWRESAAVILEQGRLAWKEGDEKLREAFNIWTKSFAEEYGNISDRWTAAYLDALHDKEAWAAAALEAAGQASSGAALALVGSGAEAGIRAMDTRDPLEWNPTGPAYNITIAEAQKMFAELLEKSGTGHLTAAFDSISGSRESLAVSVRSGLGGGIWNSGAVLAEASVLAGKIREEFEVRESGKLAYRVMNTAKDAYKKLERNIELANSEFRKNMDETFIIGGQWRRSGGRYIKDVIVHSTLFDSVITDFAEVEGYRNFIVPQTTLTSYMDRDFRNLNVLQAEEIINSVYAELNEAAGEVFGSGSEGGKFSAHIGENPVVKSRPNIDNGRAGVFDSRGTGEAGRLLTEYYFWLLKEQQGVAAVAMAPWDKPLWDSRGSVIKAPSIRSAVNIFVQVAGVVAAPFTAGSSMLGTVALGAALNTADDLLFAALDVSGGYKSWSEAGFEFGKQFLTNTVNSVVGSVFYGVEGASSPFFNTGGITGLYAGKGIDAFAELGLKTVSAGAHAVTSGAVSGLAASLSYDDESGFGFSRGDFLKSLKSGALSALPAMTGTFTGGLLNTGLTGFIDSLYTDAEKLSGFAGGIASQGVNYALGNDFTLNILDAGRFFGDSSKANAGLLELRFSRDGINLQMGSGGADASIGTLVSAFNGLEAWKVNADLLFADEEAAGKYASQMRTLYSGSDINRAEYENILAGKTKILQTDKRETESIYDSGTGIKTIYLGTGALSDSSRFGLNVVFSHESYRDGKNNGETGQIIERDNAVKGHASTANALMNTYGADCLGALIALEANLFDSDIDNNSALIRAIMDSYDTSADFWRLKRDGTLVNDNSGWLTYDYSGEFAENIKGERIGSAAGIETGLLNIIYGGTSNAAYSTFTDSQIQQVQAVMMRSGMKYTNGKDGTMRSRTWGGNKIGLKLNTGDFMGFAGHTIAAPVFARYYDSTVDSEIAKLWNRDIGEAAEKYIPIAARERYKNLYTAKSVFYKTARSFVDDSKGYYISLGFGEGNGEHYPDYNFKHYGFDLSREGVPLGDAIFAGISGMVSRINWKYNQNGNDIQIEYGHLFEGSFVGSGIFGEYLHMKDPAPFSEGMLINAANQIGQIAGTPNYDPHLHYDILTHNDNYSRSTLGMLLGGNARANSLQSIGGYNTVYNPVLYYNNFLNKSLYTKEVFMANKNK